MAISEQRSQIKNDICAVPCFNKALVESIRQAFPPDAAITAIAARYGALADPTRLKILLALTHTELCVCDISHVLALSISATSHQLRLLRNLSLVQARNDGRMVYYSLRADPAIEQLLTTLQSQGCLRKACDRG
ncbi:MAG: ArsR/SmtB family transcription factor [Armatimonadota bacterium]